MNNLDSFSLEDPADFAYQYFDYLATVCKSVDTQAVKRFVQLLLDARERGATVFFIGNGGSASTASHFANDLLIGTKTSERHFRAVSLADNNSILSAVANDFGYDDVFSLQLRALGRPGDVLVAISASGNSPNLLRCFDAAKKMGVSTFAVTAFDGGKMKSLADDGIHIPTEIGEYGPAEDAHLILNHILGSYLSRFIKKECSR